MQAPHKIISPAARTHPDKPPRSAARLAPLLRLAVCLAICLTLPLPALALVGDTQGDFGLDGSLRTVGAVLLNRPLGRALATEETTAYSQTLLRLAALGRPWDSLGYEAHLVADLTALSHTGQVRSGYLGLSAARSRYRLWDDTREMVSESDLRSNLWLDRLNVKISLPWADITLGRQAVTFGKAYFWNPMDVFLPFDPNQFDREYKGGVDALRLDVPFGPFSGCTLVAAAGRETGPDGVYLDDDGALDASFYGSAFLARAYATLQGWDLAVQGGKIYGAWQAGGGASGQIGAWGVRGEMAYQWAVDSPSLPFPLRGHLVESGLVAVAGLGQRWASSLDLQFEYLYNGLGDPGDLPAALTRLSAGNTLHMSRHLAGAVLSYELNPLITGQVAAILSLDDGSTQMQPSLTISLGDNTSLLMGASINLGQRPDDTTAQPNSEFGSYPHTVWAEFKMYF